MSEDRIRPDVLARITDNPQLARAVPGLTPEVLHAVIEHYGLQDCGELLALATPAQLTAVFDLDLWKATHAGADEQFDAARFSEWLEVLVDADPAGAAARLATMDVALVVAGLSPHLTVWDPAVFEPVDEPSSAEPVLNAGRERGVHAEIGGYLVVARRQDAWDPIVCVLTMLDEHHSEAFQRVMRACRRLSDSGRELDGLDDLLSDPQQVRFDLSVSREERRDRDGYLSSEQARAFLDSARHTRVAAEPPQDLVFDAYRRSQMTSATEMRPVSDPGEAGVDEPAADTASAIASVIEILRGAGALAEAPRALLPGAQDERMPITAALNQYLQRCAESDAAKWIARNEELAFLANALMSGCSVHGRAFSRREAMDAVSTTCNLGLDYWPPQWPASSEHDLVTIFQVGWTVLHREVSEAAADRLVDALDRVQSSDQDVQFELQVLRRELRKHRQAGTPWRARNRLEVLATLDLPAWAALTALFDECPVMLSNVSLARSRRPHTVDPGEFQFIADAGHIAAVHEFLHSLVALLT